MFRRERHRTVLTILEALDAEKLEACRFFFAGGTRIALDLREFRESHDIDFTCADRSGYADLRIVAREEGYRGLFSEEGLRILEFPREIRADQYGIRFPVVCGDTTIKVELIREGRVDLDAGTFPTWSPVRCLSRVDCYAIKILASSDRWADRGVLSRDLIDLGAMRMDWGPIPDDAWAKAADAYKSAVRSDLRKALDFFLDHSDHQRRCFTGLRVEDPTRILQAISLLNDEI